MADNDAYSFLSSVNHQPRGGTISNLNPDFATKLAGAIREARNAGLNVGIASGFRPPDTLKSQGRTGRAAAYDASGNSQHTYGMAVDVDGIGAAGSPEAQKWYDIATRNGIYNPYGVGNTSEYNHYQALPYKNLSGSDRDQLFAAYNSGDQNSIWKLGSNLIQGGGGGGSVAGAPSRPGTPTPGPLMFSGLNPGALGMRNNNPGNLVPSDWVKTLPGYKGVNGGFAVFDTPEHGAAALDSNLSSYGSKGINTPLGIASTWAPASNNNNPASYGAQIAKTLGVGPNDKIDLSDPSVRNKVAQAIGLVENGPGNSAGFRTAYVGSSTSGTTLNSPPLAAGGPGGPAATGGLAGQLATALKPLTPGGKGGGGGAGGDDQPQPMQLQQAPPAQAVGGPMMMRPGGINAVDPRIAAQNDLAQRGFSMQPQLASTYGALGATKPVVQPIMPAQATGVPGLPGTTLNSPSQLQMALMTGQISPYDMYANNPAFGGGFGST